MGSIRLRAELDVSDRGSILVTLEGADLESDWDPGAGRDLRVERVACEILIGEDGRAVGLALRAPGDDYSDDTFGALFQRALDDERAKRDLPTNLS